MTKIYIVWAESTDDLGGDVLEIDKVYFSREKAEARGEQISNLDSEDCYTYGYVIEEVDVVE